MRQLMEELGKKLYSSDVTTVLFTVVASKYNDSVLNKWGCDDNVNPSMSYMNGDLRVHMDLLLLDSDIDGCRTLIREVDGRKNRSGDVDAYKNTNEYPILQEMSDMIDHYFGKESNSMTCVL